MRNQFNIFHASRALDMYCCLGSLYTAMPSYMLKLFLIPVLATIKLPCEVVELWNICNFCEFWYSASLMEYLLDILRVLVLEVKLGWWDSRSEALLWALPNPQSVMAIGMAWKLSYLVSNCKS